MAYAQYPIDDCLLHSSVDDSPVDFLFNLLSIWTTTIILSAIFDKQSSSGGVDS